MSRVVLAGVDSGCGDSGESCGGGNNDCGDDDNSCSNDDSLGVLVVMKLVMMKLVVMVVVMVSVTGSLVGLENHATTSCV